MNEFIRENRYVVLKRSDIDKFLSTVRKEMLLSIMADIRLGRYLESKSALDCVVIEQDWPEYEVVWKMIEERCKGEYNGI